MPTTLNFDQLLAALGTIEEIHSGDSRPSIVDVTGDSRTVRPGALFVAIAGASFDGHRAIPDAIERGAAVIVGTQSVVELIADGVSPSVPYICVSDSRHALASSSAALNGYPSRELSAIGITGTDGKTSTSTILESILQAATRDAQMPNGRVGLVTTVGARILGQDSDTGFHVTTPDAPAVQRFLADMRDAGCTFAIVESTSHGLAQGRLVGVDFDVAAVTNITHEHLDYHGTWNAYASAKAELFRSLFHTTVKKDVKQNLPKMAVLNADDPGGYRYLQTALAEEAARTGRNVLIRSYGMEEISPRADVRAIDVIYHADRTTFSIEYAGGAFDVETNLIGNFNVQNILCASTIALERQVPVSAIQSGILSLAGIVGRMERIDVGQPFLALVDFAHSPASLERALLTLRTVVQYGESGQTGAMHEARHEDRHAESGGRIIAVFGSAGLRDKEKRGLMGQVSGRLADFTVITAEDPRTEDLDEINRSIEAGLLTEADADAYAIVPDRSLAIQFAVDMAKPGDIVVACGKGHERSMCFGETEFPWSDQDAVAEALNARFGS